MKRLLFFLLSLIVSYSALGQSSTDAALTTQNNNSIRGKQYNNKSAADMNKAIIDSKLNINTPAGGDLFGTYPRPSVNNVSVNVLGNIITENWNTLTNWTVVGGATFGVSSNVLTITGGTPGSIALTNYIKNVTYAGSGISNLENFSFYPVTIVVGTLTGNSFGVPLGIQKATATGGGTALQANIDLTSGSNKGKISFYVDNNTTPVKTSDTAIPISTGDVLLVYFFRDKGHFVLTVYNTSQNNASITEFYDYSFSYVSTAPKFTPSAYNFTIGAGGGTHQIRSGFKINSLAAKYSKVLECTDSKGSGFYTMDIPHRYADIINTNFTLYSVNGAPGDRIEDINPIEVLLHEPDTIICTLGANNTGDTPSTFMSKYATLLASFTSTGKYTIGINLFVSTLTPANTVDVTQFNTLIRLTYTNAFFENYYSAWSGTGTSINPIYNSGDGVHLNAFWSRRQADIIVDFLKLTPRQYHYPYASTPTYTNGLLGIGLNNNNEVPLVQLDVKGTGNGTAFRVSNAATGGAGIVSTNSSEGYLTSGTILNSSGQWVAGATAAGILGTSAGSAYLFLNTGLTVGATYTPTQRMFWNTTGLFLGGSTTPTAQLHITGGSTTLPPFKLSLGVDNTTPQLGALEYSSLSSINRLSFVATGTVRNRIPLTNDVAPTNGQLMIGNGTDYTVASLTAGSNITITPGSGSITISSTGGGGITNTAANNEIPKSNGTNIIPSGIFTSASGDLILGPSGSAASVHDISTQSSSTNTSISITPKGSGSVTTTGQFISYGGAGILNGVSSVYIGTGSVSAPENQIAMSSFSNGSFITHTRNGAAGNLTISGAAGIATLTTGANTLINGGAAYNTGNNIGGDVILAGGVGNGTGAPGRVIVNTSVGQGSGLKHQRFSTGSITGSTNALITCTWTTAFADANYTVTYSMNEATAAATGLSIFKIESQTASAVTIRVINSNAGALTGTINLIAFHD